MNQQALIEVTERSVGDESVQTVNARELHAFLEVRKDFSDWIKGQIGDVFTQGIDFEVFPQKGENGNRPRIEYALTLECAKHVAMMSRTMKGRDVRDYFIECERHAKHNAPAIDLNDPAFLRTMLLGYTEKVIALEAKVQADAPKVDFHDRYAASEGNKGFREVCKLLDANEREFRQFLISHSIMYRLNGRLMPMAHHQHAGRFDVKAGISDANNHAFNQAMFTPKGIAWVSAEWMKYQAATV